LARGISTAGNRLAPAAIQQRIGSLAARQHAGTPVRGADENAVTAVHEGRVDIRVIQPLKKELEMKATRRNAALIVIVALAMMLPAVSAVGATAPATQPAVTEVAPTVCQVCNYKERFNRLIPGVTWGADLRLRSIYDEARQLNADAPGHDRFWSRYRARIWTKYTPVQDLDFNFRVVTEPRLYCRPDILEDQFIREEAIIDKANVTWSKMLEMPLTLVVGRQDINLGSGWLVQEGTPLDGTRTSFFDAINLLYDAESIDTLFNLIVLYDHTNSSAWARPFNDRDLDLIEQNETGVILYGSNDSVENTTIDGYFMYKHDTKQIPSGVNADIYTFGARIAGKKGEHWVYSAEAAPQWGHKNGSNICAFGSIGDVAYNFNDPHKQFVHSGWEYRSGNGGRFGEFDILWGRIATWSNLWNDYIGPLEYQTSQPSNFYRWAIGYGFSPWKDAVLTFNYNLLFAHQNPFGQSAGFTQEGKFRGQDYSVVLNHVINHHVSGQALAEFFAPGNYYDDTRNDMAIFLRYQLMFSW
jgi:hypothetical protein